MMSQLGKMLMQRYEISYRQCHDSNTIYAPRKPVL